MHSTSGKSGPPLRKASALSHQQRSHNPGHPTPTPVPSSSSTTAAPHQVPSLPTPTMTNGLHGTQAKVSAASAAATKKKTAATTATSSAPVAKPAPVTRTGSILGSMRSGSPINGHSTSPSSPTSSAPPHRTVSALKAAHQQPQNNVSQPGTSSGPPHRTVSNNIRSASPSAAAPTTSGPRVAAVASTVVHATRKVAGVKTRVASKTQSTPTDGTAGPGSAAASPTHSTRSRGQDQGPSASARSVSPARTPHSPAVAHRGSRILDGGVGARSVSPPPIPSSPAANERRILATPTRSASPPPASRSQAATRPTRKIKAAPAELKTSTDPTQPAEKKENTAGGSSSVGKGPSQPHEATVPKKAEVSHARDPSPAFSDGFSSFGSSDDEESSARKAHSNSSSRQPSKQSAESTQPMAGTLGGATAVTGKPGRTTTGLDAKHSSKSDESKTGTSSARETATKPSHSVKHSSQKADMATRPKTAAATPPGKSKEGSGSPKASHKHTLKTQPKSQPASAAKSTSPSRTAMLTAVAAAKFRASIEPKRLCDKCRSPYKGFGTTCSNCRQSGKIGAAIVCKGCRGFFQGYGAICQECKLEEDRAALFRKQAEAAQAEAAKDEEAAAPVPKENVSESLAENRGAPAANTAKTEAFAPSSSEASSRQHSKGSNATMDAHWRAGASPQTSAREPLTHSKSAILATVAAVKFREATSDQRHCDKCGDPYKGFGTTCGKCRHFGKRGTALVCVACQGFFQGYGTMCAECRVEEERILLLSKQADTIETWASAEPVDQAVDRSDEFSAFDSSDGEAAPTKKPPVRAADGGFGGSTGSLLGSREESFESLSQAAGRTGDPSFKHEVIQIEDVPAFSDNFDKDVAESSFTTPEQFPDPPLPIATTVLEAVRAGTASRLSELLAEGGDANEATSEGVTALLTAAVLGNEELVSILISAGADVNRSDSFGSTPLQSAAFDGHFRVVRALLKAGAAVDAQDCEGFTALHFAVRNTCGEPGFQEVLDDLVAAGADTTMEAKDGSSPASAAEEFVKTMTYLQQIGDAWRP